MANKLIVSEKEINVNGYIVNSVDLPEVTYNYLYYEPAANNTFKILQVEGTSDYQQVLLTEDEINVCEAYCTSFDSTPYNVEVIDTSVENLDAEQVFLVASAEGSYKGEITESDMVAGDVKVPVEIPQLHNPWMIDPSHLIWDGSTWSVSDLSSRRRLKQLEAAPATDQLDFLIKAVDALSKGQSVPSEVSTFIANWKQIKLDNV